MNNEYEKFRFDSFVRLSSIILEMCMYCVRMQFDRGRLDGICFLYSYANVIFMIQEELMR